MYLINRKIQLIVFIMFDLSFIDGCLTIRLNIKMS